MWGGLVLFVCGAAAQNAGSASTWCISNPGIAMSTEHALQGASERLVDLRTRPESEGERVAKCAGLGMWPWQGTAVVVLRSRCEPASVVNVSGGLLAHSTRRELLRDSGAARSMGEQFFRPICRLRACRQGPSVLTANRARHAFNDYWRRQKGAIHACNFRARAGG
jgi:hypothetical protein